MPLCRREVDHAVHRARHIAMQTLVDHADQIRELHAAGVLCLLDAKQTLDEVIDHVDVMSVDVRRPTEPVEVLAWHCRVGYLGIEFVLGEDGDLKARIRHAADSAARAASCCRVATGGTQHSSHRSRVGIYLDGMGADLWLLEIMSSTHNPKWAQRPIACTISLGRL